MFLFSSYLTSVDVTQPPEKTAENNLNTFKTTSVNTRKSFTVMNSLNRSVGKNSSNPRSKSLSVSTKFNLGEF